MQARHSITLVGLVLTGLLSGCASHAATDAAVGGAAGAGAGALLGSATGHTGAGAVIGTGVGAVTGAVVGDAQDQREKREAAHAVAMNGYLTLQDILYMTQSGVHELTIVREIQATRSVFHLTPTDIVYLKDRGVAENVINAMVDSGRAVVYGRRVRQYSRSHRNETAYQASNRHPQPHASRHSSNKAG